MPAVWTSPSPHGPPPASRDVIDLAADSGAQLPYGADVPMSKFDSLSSVRIALRPVVVSPVFWGCRLHLSVAGLLQSRASRPCSKTCLAAVVVVLLRPPFEFSPGVSPPFVFFRFPWRSGSRRLVCPPVCAPLNYASVGLAESDAPVPQASFPWLLPRFLSPSFARCAPPALLVPSASFSCFLQDVCHVVFSPLLLLHE